MLAVSLSVSFSLVLEWLIGLAWSFLLFNSISWENPCLSSPSSVRPFHTMFCIHGVKENVCYNHNQQFCIGWVKVNHVSDPYDPILLVHKPTTLVSHIFFLETVITYEGVPWLLDVTVQYTSGGGGIRPSWHIRGSHCHSNDWRLMGMNYNAKRPSYFWPSIIGGALDCITLLCTFWCINAKCFC